jgi:hypothetical protein
LNSSWAGRKGTKRTVQRKKKSFASRRILHRAGTQEGGGPKRRHGPVVSIRRAESHQGDDELKIFPNCLLNLGQFEVVPISRHELPLCAPTVSALYRCMQSERGALLTKSTFGPVLRAPRSSCRQIKFPSACSQHCRFDRTSWSSQPDLVDGFICANRCELNNLRTRSLCVQIFSLISLVGFYNAVKGDGLWSPSMLFGFVWYLLKQRCEVGLG